MGYQTLQTHNIENLEQFEHNLVRNQVSGDNFIFDFDNR